MRRHARIAALLLGAGLSALSAGAARAQADARAQEAPAAETAVTPGGAPEVSFADGFARILFAFEAPVQLDASLSSGVVVARFNRPLALDTEDLKARLQGIASMVRLEPDRRTLRIALAMELRLHASTGGMRAAIDLVPPTFRGEPPDLPQPPPPPPDPLAGLPKDGPLGAEALAALPVLPVRIGEHANFTRLVFDWPEAVDYEVTARDGALEIRFRGAARPDLSALERRMPPFMRSAAFSVDGNGTAVRLGVDMDSPFHHFRDGARVALDVLAPGTEADAYRPPRAPGEAGPAPKPILPSALAAAASMAEPAPRPAIAPPAAADDPPPADEAAGPAARLPLPNPLRLAEAPPAAPPPRGSDAAAALEPDAPSTAALTSVPDRDGVTLDLGLEAGEPVAVAQREGHVLVAFAGGIPEGMGELAARHRAVIAAIEAVPAEGGTVLNITLAAPLLVSAASDGGTWRLRIAERAELPVDHIEATPEETVSGRVEMRIVRPGFGVPVTARDPLTGSRLVLVPAPAGAGVLKLRRTVAFDLLPTASGVAVLAHADDLTVTRSGDAVVLAQPGGLPVRAAAMAVALPPVLAEEEASESPAWADFAAWGAREDAVAQRALREAAMARLAGASGEALTHARLGLARFFVANRYGAEALAPLSLVLEAEPGRAEDPAFLVLRGLASLIAGRPDAALRDFDAAKLGGDPHLALWRGLALAAQRRWAEARTALIDAGDAAARLPEPWRSRVALAEAEAAIALGDPARAGTALAGVAPAALTRLRAEETEFLKARLEEMTGALDAAREAYDALEARALRPVAVRAAYAGIMLDRARKAITADEAIERLETLRYRWRGDHVEIATLRALGEVYREAGRPREALETLRLAVVHFPGTEDSRAANDDMRALFVRLFLDGEADVLAPVQALALFYDFKTLTPLGARGDEMIRKLADRLVAVDLLPQAAELLQHQIDERLEGVARAQVAARLAALYLLDREPERALAALNASRQARLPQPLIDRRRLLEARALAGLKRHDQALEVIALDESEEAQRLRADIAWAAQDWPDAGSRLAALADARTGRGALDEIARRDLLRAAIAYGFASDADGLQRLVALFGARMAETPDAAAFRVLTDAPERRGVEFRELAREIAGLDTLSSFMDSFRRGEPEEAVN